MSACLNCWKPGASHVACGECGKALCQQCHIDGYCTECHGRGAEVGAPVPAVSKAHLLGVCRHDCPPAVGDPKVVITVNGGYIAAIIGRQGSLFADAELAARALAQAIRETVTDDEDALKLFQRTLFNEIMMDIASVDFEGHKAE